MGVAGVFMRRIVFAAAGGINAANRTRLLRQAQ
jgi:hypothetical protein